jgi:Zn-dependent protease
MFIDRLLNDPYEFILYIIAIIMAITVHEAAHAWSADELGDPTARLLGRKSLDPRRHLELWGSLMFLFAGFGWGKPVPVDSFNLRDEVKDNALIALAGPASNLLMAIVFGTIYRFLPNQSGELASILFAFGWVNISLAVFNLLPIPPLDGSKIYRAILPRNFMPVWYFLDQYGTLVLFFLVVSGSGILSRFTGPTIIAIMRILGF